MSDMRHKSNQGLVGAVFIGLGCGLAAVGIALVVPACAEWSLSLADRALRRGREAVGSAADTLAEVAGSASQHFDAAAKVAKSTTAKAAGVVETAARQVREYAS
jgi:hypothetical protein